MKNSLKVEYSLLVSPNSFCSHSTEETETQRQLADINRRYDALDAKIDERDDELDTALALTERAKPVDDLLQTVTKMEAALVNSAPMPSRYGAPDDDLDSLEQALEQITVILSSFFKMVVKLAMPIKIIVPEQSLV